MLKVKNLPGILIEVKAAKDKSQAELKALAQTAIRQIDEKQYETELRTYDVETIFKYGVAFSGKNVEIIME